MEPEATLPTARMPNQRSGERAKEAKTTGEPHWLPVKPPKMIANSSTVTLLLNRLGILVALGGP